MQSELSLEQRYNIFEADKTVSEECFESQKTKVVLYLDVYSLKRIQRLTIQQISIVWTICQFCWTFPAFFLNALQLASKKNRGNPLKLQFSGKSKVKSMDNGRGIKRTFIVYNVYPHGMVSIWFYQHALQQDLSQTSHSLLLNLIVDLDSL